jgi:ABC-type molybdate transport system substrate-binding protein
MLKAGALIIGNLVLSIKPHVFISPPHVLVQLQTDGFVQSHRLLAFNQGSVLLVRKKNPKEISSVKDLMRRDVRLFISNPDMETVSYRGYRQTLEAMAADQGVHADAFSKAVFGDTAVWGRRIHHREAPEALAAGRADVAIVYYHLALRYVRIFPDAFDFVPLGGTQKHPAPHPQNRIAAIHMGLVGQGGLWGQRFITFMRSPIVADIYAHHGLRAN